VRGARRSHRGSWTRLSVLDLALILITLHAPPPSVAEGDGAPNDTFVAVFLPFASTAQERIWNHYPCALLMGEGQTLDQHSGRVQRRHTHALLHTQHPELAPIPWTLGLSGQHTIAQVSFCLVG